MSNISRGRMPFLVLINSNKLLQLNRTRVM